MKVKGLTVILRRLQHFPTVHGPNAVGGVRECEIFLDNRRKERKGGVRRTKKN